MRKRMNTRSLLLGAMTALAALAVFSGSLALAAGSGFGGEAQEPVVVDPSPTEDTPQAPADPAESAAVAANAAKIAGERGLEVVGERPLECSSFVEVVDNTETGEYQGICLDKLDLRLSDRWELGRQLRGMAVTPQERSDFRDQMAVAEASE